MASFAGGFRLGQVTGQPPEAAGRMAEPPNDDKCNRLLDYPRGKNRKKKHYERNITHQDAWQRAAIAWLGHRDHALGSGPD